MKKRDPSTLTAVSVTIARVGVQLWDGAESMGYELTSDFVSITVADLGAHLTSVVLRLADGEQLEVTVGYPEGGPTGFHGASIGRYANRIAGSKFTLDGEDYHLEPNEGQNQLHGGSDGFWTYAWSADAELDGDTGRVVLKHKSKDGDMGFPGKVQATAIYELTDNQLTINYRAKVDRPTPVNLTNHTYWNLGGPGPIGEHQLTVAAGQYVDVDDANLPVAGPPVPISDTRFDCRTGRGLADIVDHGGYDHCFVLDEQATPQATLSHPSGRRIDVATNQVGLQVYTGQPSEPANRGIALETQALPDTPNRPDFGDVTVRPGDKYLNTTTFTFEA